MSDDQDNTKGIETIVGQWMNTSTELWKAWSESWLTASQNPPPAPEPAEPETKKKPAPEDIMQGLMQSFQAIGAAFAEPEGIAALFKGGSVLPDLLSRFTGSAWQSGLDFHRQWLDKSARIGRKTNAYQFDNLDQEIFRFLGEIYEKEFRQYFNIPQLGLNRFYVERLHKAQDAFNILQTKMSEFLFVLYLPVEKSFHVMQQQMTEKAKTGDLPDNPDDYYRTWIKILEGHYLTLFQTEEYTKVLNRTIEAAMTFKSSKEAVMGDILQSLSIPTQKELDELYKELYDTKKRLRALEKAFKNKKT